MAIEHGNLTVVEALVKAGCDVNERVSVQANVLPLHIAIRTSDEDMLPHENEVVAFLLRAGANPNTPIGTLFITHLLSSVSSDG